MLEEVFSRDSEAKDAVVPYGKFQECVHEVLIQAAPSSV